MERAGDEHEIYRDIMRKLFVINRLHHVSIESRAEKLCLHRSQHMMLVVISMADKPLTQRELSERLDISPSSVVFFYQPICRCNDAAQIARRRICLPHIRRERRTVQQYFANR